VTEQNDPRSILSSSSSRRIRIRSGVDVPLDEHFIIVSKREYIQNILLTCSKGSYAKIIFLSLFFLCAVEFSYDMLSKKYLIKQYLLHDTY